VLLATWNVNSLRARLPRVLDWLATREPDVVALQETKCTEKNLPRAELEAAGYEVAHQGFNQWNGVAVLSRVGLSEVTVGFDGMPEFEGVSEARALGATCDGIRVWSLYIPNGRVPDSPHYEYKLRWLAALRDAGAGWLEAQRELPVALCGDFNIAPTDDDVWDPAVFAESTHVTPRERAAFAALVDSGYADVVRPFTPGPGVYTYWDYQQLRFPRREGMRIDFVLGSAGLQSRVSEARIDREARKGKGPSDHAPVLVELS
jgi:exodeoxyribonuclease-3